MSREGSAGVTLAALMIPLNIGYAQVAGLPPAAGLYAAIIPLVVFALLASSRHLTAERAGPRSVARRRHCLSPVGQKM
jgi:MFS superfamily sulfate permease-like transporter